VGLLVAVVLLSHVFTGVPMLRGVAAILIGSWETLTPRDWICWAVSAAAGLAVLLAWPCWNVFDLRQDASLDTVHWWLYDQMIPWIGLALMLGVLALAARFRRDRRDPLVLLFLLCGAAVVYGWVSGHYSWGRLTPALVLAVQLATAIELVRLGGGRWRRSTYALTAALALLLGAWVQAGAVLLAFPKARFRRT
jgi:hypothetical protein